ncbi:MAG: 7-cyano-7-deazaguanine synthase QueC [bacterium]|nr:7-cyano-7-deazaguanine synthase QueC [bacterium]
MMTANKDAIVLLSGGLDSLVAIGYIVSDELYNIKLALTFDYGQKSARREIESSKKISDYYKIEHKVIKLDWLKEITKTSLVSSDDIPTSNLLTEQSAKSVWVPNRNALFLNIAACYCDTFNYKYIIYGANKDESKNFPDNTEDFRSSITRLFTKSTLVMPEVTAPLIKYSKSDIVKIAVGKQMPLNLIWSCYSGENKHCGKCESCNHLKQAFITNRCEKYIEELFGEV